MSDDFTTILAQLESLADPEAVAGMARYGIVGNVVYGIKMPVLRQMAKEIGKDHELAQELWAADIRETRILASLVDDRKLVDEAQMERWVADFDSWEVCDQVCSNLFGRTPHAYAKALDWSGRPEEFVKRAGFVLMARAAHKDMKTPNADLLACLPIIEREANDDRNFVRKAVNWALRDIGKRNLTLNVAAIETAERLTDQDSKNARWNGRDALRELTSPAVQARLNA
ncbi:MAG: DNA alkylation repair protein [Chloroflexota bacterium]